MLEFVLSLLAVIRVFLRSRSDTALEVLVLRQQVAVLKRKRQRPVLNSLDRFFWTTLCSYWSRWKDVLVIVVPDTVIRTLAATRFSSAFKDAPMIPGCRIRELKH